MTKYPITFQDVKHLFEHLYPDVNHRHCIIKIFSESIEYSEQFDIQLVRLSYGKQLILYIGNTAVLKAGYDKKANDLVFWVNIDNDKNQVLLDTSYWDIHHNYYLSSNLTYWQQTIKALHFLAIQKIAKKCIASPQNITIPHHRAIIQYFNHALNIILPEPSHSDPQIAAFKKIKSISSTIPKYITDELLQENFKRAFPNPIQQHTVLKIFADAINYIDSLEGGEGYWKVTYKILTFRIVLTIGNNHILSAEYMRKTPYPVIWISVDRKASQHLQEGEQWQWDHHATHEYYTNIDSRNGFYLSHDLVYWKETIKPLHFISIDKAYEKYQGLPISIQATHHPEVTHLINQELSTQLPEPNYQNFISIGADGTMIVKPRKFLSKKKQEVSYERIKEAFETTFPDKKRREVVLTIFAESIEYINQFENGHRYWSVSCSNNPYHAHFHVGHNILINFNMYGEERRGRLWLSIDSAMNEIIQLEDNDYWDWDKGSFYPYYPSIHARNGYYLCPDLSYWYEVIKPLYFQTIDNTHAKYTKGLHSNSRHKHDPKLVDYINDQLGLNLAQPCYEGKPAAVTNYIDEPDDISYSEQPYKEGTVKKISVNRYERDGTARQACIDHYGAVCQACGMDFHKQYGDLGKGFIHVHHITPLHTIQESYEVDPIKDLVPVCPNCHAMIHRIKDTTLSIDELKQRIQVNNETND